jgi:hypothetical protein
MFKLLLKLGVKFPLQTPVPPAHVGVPLAP